MTDRPHNRPTEPGWYWARERGLRWVPVEVVAHGAFVLRYFAFGLGNSRPVERSDVEWGERITMPDERTAARGDA